MRHVLLSTLLLLSPTAAFAEQHCQASEPRSLELDLAGARTVMFEVHSHDLHLDARPGARPAFAGRACASRADLLKDLTVTQQRSGDKLVVTLEARPGTWTGLGNGYAYLDMRATVPDDVLVQLKVGSGDAWASGASALSADLGSGDVDIRNIKGAVTAKVGSGDLDVTDVGSFDLLAVGSGDVKARNIRGTAKIGSIGSGDVDVETVGGAVEAGTVGSGDLGIAGVGGGVTVESIGSGDLDVRDVGGDLRVGRKGSGDIRHRGVRGAVSLPRKD
ncbi:MAG TPA: hypothetical protein DDZ67_08705 [Xanthomonadaceae bacterium]|nr:hypothetical protein [Xanthomonadaceae bacterium]